MNLIPSTALTNVRVGISTSSSPDLGPLGLLEGHFRLAVGELARTVLLLGGSLQYGGHLDPSGYTAFLLSELQRFRRAGDLLSVVLAWPVHRRLPLHAIRQSERQMAAFGTITCLDAWGNPIDCAEGRHDDPVDVPDADVAPALSAMRWWAAAAAQGRVFIGGQRSRYSGAMPGVLEEAVFTVGIGKPVYLAGGFGGVTLDAIRTVDPSAAEWLPAADVPVDDAGLTEGIVQLANLVADRGWDALSNGLGQEENERLAATHRPSEIAALVALGLGRVATNHR